MITKIGEIMKKRKQPEIIDLCLDLAIIVLNLLDSDVNYVVREPCVLLFEYGYLSYRSTGQHTIIIMDMVYSQLYAMIISLTLTNTVTNPMSAETRLGNL
jgi:hypothetical protein